jgi:cysteine desulfurase/selenocysteine lyase
VIAVRTIREASTPPAGPPLDVDAIRRDFPVLAREVNGRPLCYLDNAASSQRPRAVIDAISRYYETSHANVHRGVHTLSQEATDLFEGAREKLRRFVNARSTREIVFVRGTTEAINLVAQSYGRPRLKPGDEIVVSRLEHHANIVPWQMLCEQTGAVLRVIPITRSGEVDFEAFLGLLGERTRLLALSHVSNALGTVVPVERYIREARRRGVPVLLDGAQAAPHLPVDVQALDCDFYCFSGHKMCGPTGIGVLWGRESLLEAMPPWQGGGDMILAVSFERTVYNGLPYKFEAGTPHIAGAIGLGAAVDYLESLGLERIAAAEHDLLVYATRRLAEVPGLAIVGTAPEKAAVVSFTVEGVHPHDLGTILDHEGVAIRTGHHCAMPVMDFFGVPATARASFAFYNTRAEVDRLVDALDVARGMLT